MEPIGIAVAMFIVLAAVTRAIANPLSAALVRARARRLPLPLRSRLEEEWLAELDAMPYFWERLLFAISLALSRQQSFAHPAEGTAETRAHAALATAWTKCAHFLVWLGINFLPFLLIELLFKAAGLSTEIVLIFGACLPWGRWSRAGTGVGKPDWRLHVLMRILFVPLIPEMIRLFSSGWLIMLPFCFPAMPNLPYLPRWIRAKGTTSGRRIAALLKEFFLWVPFALVLTGIVHLLPAVTGFSEAALFKIHILGLSPMLFPIILLAAKEYRRAEFVSLLCSWAGINKQQAPTETKFSGTYPSYAWRGGMITSNAPEVHLAHRSGARQHLHWCLGVIGFYVVYGGFRSIGLVVVLPGYLPLVVTSFLLSVSFVAVAIGFYARARVPKCNVGETIESHLEQPETLRVAQTAWTAFSGSAMMGIIGFWFTGMTVSLAVGAGSFVVLLLSGPRWLTPTRNGLSA